MNYLFDEKLGRRFIKNLGTVAASEWLREPLPAALPWIPRNTNSPSTTTARKRGDVKLGNGFLLAVICVGVSRGFFVMSSTAWLKN